LNITETIGILAGIFTTLAVTPQIVKAWKTKRIEDVSPLMFVILISGVGLWVVYGILKNDWPIILANGVSLALNASMLYILIRYNSE